MANITDPELGNWLRNTLEDVHRKLQASSIETHKTGIDLHQSQKQFFTYAHDTCSNKIKIDDTLFETNKVYKRDLEQLHASAKEKMSAVSQMMSDMEVKDTQKDHLSQKIESLREEHAKRKATIVSQNKANKLRMKNLNQAKQIFQNHLGLEIRKIHGDKLQFIFTNISQADPDSVYTFLLRITPDGTYQISSSDPPLECMAHLEKRLLETNNFSAFLANVRKEFAALSK